MRIIVLAMLALAATCGACRRPPIPEPVPADAAPLSRDASAEDSGPSRDGSVSDCVSLPNLTCAVLAAEASASGELWTDRTQSALDPIQDELRDALDASGGALCGQTSAGVVHYLGDDTQVHFAFQDQMDGWTSEPIVFEPDGRPCGTLQDFERQGLQLRLRTRRAQASFSLELRASP